MTSFSLLPVETVEDIASVAELAREIWTEHFPPIISAAQTAYMIETFQSVEAISRQITEDGYQYYLLQLGLDRIGYTAVHPEPENHAMFLSKIYIRKHFRGRGFSRNVMEFIASLARECGLATIYLTVNKNNLSSLAVYEKLGFVRARELVTGIGHGFVMDDYVMEKYL
ncbi:MAG: GNAT family N-acetyltransferase [Methanocalculaceae archaeon]|jgi:ribosomal protein S18 acetylase RimI-like enzyme|nr:GNAT family N-acetyltransferase [Methanocalculaceae archaeon]